MNDAERIEYKRRRKAKIATLVTIKHTIEHLEKTWNIKVSDKDETKIIVNTLFEMFANICAVHGINLEQAIETVIAESGADTVLEYIQSKQNSNDEDIVKMIILTIADALQGDDDDERE